MEQQPPDPLPDESPSVEATESLVPLRKRQRQNLQDVSNTKSLTPIRASGRIRIKMSAAAAEQKLPEPRAKSPKVIIANPASIKQKRRPKKLKTDLVSELGIDVKRPSSVLVDTSIRALLTNIDYSQLSPENQKILIESLPLVDRPSATSKENQSIDLNPSSINNEFFNRACIEWRDRLSNGEFTNEHQTKLRAEHEREKSKIDPWKARNFEGIWGIKTNGHGHGSVGAMMEKSALEMKDMVEQGDFEIPEGYISEVWKEDEICEEEEVEKGDDEDWKPSQPESPPTDDFLPSETTITQTEFIDSPEEPEDNSPAFEQPVIAEATSSADSSIAANDIEEDSTVDFMRDDVFSNEIASHVELSNEGVPTRWCHQQEHDYLKNIEPESSGMDEMDATFDCELNSQDIQCDDTSMDEAFELGNITRIINNVSSNPRINSYDAELPQEIFHKPERMSTSIQSNCSNLLLSNFVHHHEVVQQVIDTPRFNNTVIVKDEKHEPLSFNQESGLVLSDAGVEDLGSYHGKNWRKNFEQPILNFLSLRRSSDECWKECETSCFFTGWKIQRQNHHRRGKKIVDILEIRGLPRMHFSMEFHCSTADVTLEY